MIQLSTTRRQFLGGVALSLVPLPARATAPLAGETPVVLDARAGLLGLDAKAETAILGFGGKVPGPLLRVRKGESIKLRFVNGLAEPACVTWHGLRIANAMDGMAGLTQRPVLPGAHFDYAFTPPDSGTYWYHANALSKTAGLVARGLYGVVIVEEPSAPSVDKDMLLVIDDWALDARGQIAPGSGPALVTVNAKPAPATIEAAPGARLRLRIVNVCAARIAFIGIAGAVASVIAIDGQPSEIFQPARGVVPLGPGSRVELMLDCPLGASDGVGLVLRGEGEADKPLLHIKIDGTPISARGPVAKLPDNPLLPTRIPLERSTRCEVVIARGQPGRWTINGIVSEGWSAKPLFRVKRGGAVTLTFANKTEAAQQMHIHGHVWRLLHDLDDGWDPYWRDSVLLAPGKTKHVAFIADNPGKWALVSSILDRQDAGLAAWFEVA